MNALKQLAPLGVCDYLLPLFLLLFLSTALQGQVPLNFNYTGSMQSWMVPAGGGSGYIGGVTNGQMRNGIGSVDGLGAITHSLVVNDLCTDPQEIFCNETITGNTEAANPDTPACTGNTDGGGGLWYSFVGTREQVIVSTNNPGTNFDTRLTVFTATCSELICIDENDNISSQNNTSQISFFAASGGVYRILVDGPNGADGNFELSLFCGDPCENALDLDCDDVLIGNIEDWPIVTAPFCADQGTGRGVWVTFVGDGQCTILSSCAVTAGERTEFHNEISVFTGTCSDLECVIVDKRLCIRGDVDNARVYFQTEVGVRYYALMQGFGDASGTYNISRGCTPLEMFVDCLEDQTLACGEEIPAAATTEAAFEALGGRLDYGACRPPFDQSYTVTHEDFPGECFADNYLLRRVYTLVNNYSGLTATCEQLFFCADPAPLEIVCPSDIELACGEEVPPGPTSVEDFLALGGEIISDGSCDPSDLRVWYEDDFMTGECGSIEFERFYEVRNVRTGESAACIVQVRRDPPAQAVVTSRGPIIVECLEDIYQEELTEYFILSYPDVVCGLGSVQYVEVSEIMEGGTCGQMAILTTTVIDECDRVSQAEQVIDICNDGLQVTCPADRTITCVDEIQSPDPSLFEDLEVITPCGEYYGTTIPLPELEEGIYGCDGSVYQVELNIYIEGGILSANCVQRITLEAAPLEYELQHPDLAGLPSNSTIEIACTGSDQLFPDFDMDDVDFFSDCGSEVDVVFESLDLGAADCQADGYLHRYQYTWTGTDECDRVLTYSIFLDLVDRTAPVLQNVPATMTIGCMDPLPAVASVTATDECACVCTEVDFREELISEAGCTGSYELRRIWTARDYCGNEATATQSIYVIDDTAPEVTFAMEESLVNRAHLVFDCDQDRIPSWLADLDENSIKIYDACSSSIQVEYIPNSDVNFSCYGNDYLEFHQPSWIVDDGCGNTTTFSLTIEIVDNTAPGFETSAELFLCPDGSEYGIAMPTDDCSNESYTFFDEAHPDCDGLMLRHYEVTDECGNTAFFEQTLVDLTSAPQLITLAAGVEEPAPVYECDLEQDRYTNYSAADVIPSWECLSDLEIAFTERIIPNSCEDGGAELSLVWTATTACGYQSTLEYTVAIADNTAPTFAPFVAHLELKCGEVLPSLEAFDDCGDVEMTYTQAEVAGDCGDEYGLLRTITATDACGRATSVTQMIAFMDNEPPVFEEAETVCVAEASTAIKAWDVCAGREIAAILIEEEDASSCTAYPVTARTWQATDDCGNTSEFTQYVYPDEYELTYALDNARLQYLIETNISTLRRSEGIAQELIEDLDAFSVYATNPCGAILYGDFSAVNTVQEDCSDGIGEVITFTWFFLDICGEQYAYSQSFDVIYDEAPTIEIVEELEVYCSFELPVLEILNENPAYAYDVWEQDFRNVDGDGIVVRTVAATDRCGNTNYAAQTINCFNTSDLQCAIDGDFTPVCHSENNLYTVDIVGGTAPYLIEWEVNGGNCFIVSTYGNTAEINVGYGLATITVTVIDANGCETTCNATLNCEGFGTSQQSGEDTPGKGGNALSVQDSNPLNIQVFPNPFTDQLSIVLDASVEPGYTLQLLNPFGQLVKRITESGYQTHLDVTTLPSGMYQLLIEWKNGREIRQVVKVD